METAIGNLGNEIRQDRDPYANIAQRGVLRAQINSITAMMPQVHLKNESSIPSGALNVSGGYVLLRACQPTLIDVSESEVAAIMEFWSRQSWPNQDGWPWAVRCWARLRLPHGQVACSRWMEARSHQRLCEPCMIKVRCDITVFKSILSQNTPGSFKMKRPRVSLKYNIIFT